VKIENFFNALLSYRYVMQQLLYHYFLNEYIHIVTVPNFMKEFSYFIHKTILNQRIQ